MLPYVVLAQPFVAERRQAEQAAEGRDGARGEAGYLHDFLAGGEPQFPPALDSAHGTAVELPVCRDDEHDKAVFALTDQGLGSAGQWRATDSGCLFTRIDRLVPQHLEGDALLL